MPVWQGPCHTVVGGPEQMPAGPVSSPTKPLIGSVALCKLLFSLGLNFFGNNPPLQNCCKDSGR